MGVGAAALMRRWHSSHPSELIFAAGSVAVVIVGVPDLAWFFVSALGCAALFAAALFAVRAAQTRRARTSKPLGLA